MIQSKIQDIYTQTQIINDYPSAPDKIEIKREMLSQHQLKIAGL